jgi:predicted alpha/beta-hydrolase family hydrolase
MEDARDIEIPTERGPVQALALEPTGAEWLYVFAHGAGAGMRHRFMEAAARDLFDRGIATLRYEYRYMSEGGRGPERAPALEATTRAVVAYAAATWPKLRIAAGGKSMGGRMTSRAQAAAPLDRLEALVFYGFPLHPPKKPGIERAEHLDHVRVPMLFLQGTRDDLAELELMRSVTDRVGSLATLHVVEGADHSFAVLKRSGRTAAEVMAELANAAAGFLAEFK